MDYPPLTESLRAFVRERAHYLCEYCKTAEWLNGMEGEIDHIIPRARAGPTDADNLCYACASCNAHKHARTHGVDPETGIGVSLYHPRDQVWREHFAWSDDGSPILGLTSCGRATIMALQVNNPFIVRARAIWVAVGYHPPGRGVELETVSPDDA